MGFFTRWIDKLYDKLDRDRPILDPANVLNLTPGAAYWRDYLTERVIRIFEWSGLPMPQRVVELATLMTGFSGFVNDERAGFVCLPGSLSGPTPYPIIFDTFIYAAPKCAGGHKDIFPTNPFGSAVIISNNELRLGVADMIERYAVLLAHADCSIGNSLVNARYDVFLRTEDDAKTSSIMAWRGKVMEGEVLPIVDESLTEAPAVVPLQNAQKGQIVLDMIDARKEILRQFYAEIGIRIMPEKRGNLITAEVSENDQALLFNIGDMLRCRQDAAANINKLFGLNVSVKLSPEFERIQDPVDDGDN